MSVPVTSIRRTDWSGFAKISKILDKIDDKQLFVPAFQREYVWKHDDAKSLIHLLLKEYPTGTMLTWDTANPPELKGPYRYDQKQGAVKLILDGKQRITTLYMLICGEIPLYYKTFEIKSGRQVRIGPPAIKLHNATC